MKKWRTLGHEGGVKSLLPVAILAQAAVSAQVLGRAVFVV